MIAPGPYETAMEHALDEAERGNAHGLRLLDSLTDAELAEWIAWERAVQAAVAAESPC